MASDLKPWFVTANEYQQEMCDAFGEVDWDMYKENERQVLKDKVKLILYGLSDVKEDTKKIIDDICDAIIKEGTHNLVADGKRTETATYMVFIFVVGSSDKEKTDCWPVFKVPKDESGVNATFIDLTCRVYKNWTDFLENNKLPACKYCYPKNGRYYKINDKVVIEFGQSPEAKLPKQVLNVLDTTSTSVAFGSTALTLASLFVPVAGPLLTASMWAMGGVSAYSTYRSTKVLHDRNTHKQSINLDDPESRNCYLSIAGSALGLGASAATSATVKMAQSGQVMGKLATSAVTTLNASALVVNGMGIVNGFCHILEKHKEGELTTFEVAQFSASLLLFCHASANFKTARSIIESTQNDVINSFKKDLRSNKHRNAFKKLEDSTLKRYGDADGKALVIRSINHINNVDEFFAAVVRTDKSMRYTKAKVHFAEEGLILVDNGVPLDPRQLAQLNKDQRVTFLRATKKYSLNKISDAKFRTITDSLLGDKPTTSFVSSDAQKTSTSNRLLQTSRRTDGQINILKFLPTALSASQLLELQNLLKKFAVEFQRIVLKLSKCLFQTLELFQSTVFMEVSYFVSCYVEHLILLALNGQREYLLSILKDNIRNIPHEKMTCGEYCLAVLEELLLNPLVLKDMYDCIKSFFVLLQEKSSIRTRDTQVDILELISATTILMKMDKPMWHTVTDFAIQSFHSLGLQKFSSLVAIAKDLCSYIEQVVLDIHERYRESFVNTNNEDENKNEYYEYCAMALKALDDDEVKHFLQEKYSGEFSKTKNCHSNANFQYVKGQPLVLEKCFWEREQVQFLTEEEILDVCKQTLEIDDYPLDFSVEYDGLNVLVHMVNEVVVIECDVQEGRINAYVDHTVLTGYPTPNKFDREETFLQSNLMNTVNCISPKKYL